jgi:signal peptidase I
LKLKSGARKRSEKTLKETDNRFVLSWRKLKKNVFFAFFLDILTIVVSALVLSLLIKTFIVRSFYIPSGSMLNTLQINDRIVVNELVPDFSPLHRGDVVVFEDPGGWLTPESDLSDQSNPLVQAWDQFLSVFGFTAPDSRQHLVKRVIGLPGDHVVCCSVSKKILINGVEIDETPYFPEGTDTSYVKFDVTVPADSYWVMGDNRTDSQDSRYHLDLPSKGFVGKQFIVGHAFVITWPKQHWTWLGSYPDVFKDVPNK